MSDELKPCPFCGGAAKRVDNGPSRERGNHTIAWGEDCDVGGSFIECTRCQSSSAIHFDRKENLVSAWNQRTAQ